MAMRVVGLDFPGRLVQDAIWLEWETPADDGMMWHPWCYGDLYTFRDDGEGPGKLGEPFTPCQTPDHKGGLNGYSESR